MNNGTKMITSCSIHRVGRRWSIPRVGRRWARAIPCPLKKGQRKSRRDKDVRLHSFRFNTRSSDNGLLAPTDELDVMARQVCLSFLCEREMPGRLCGLPWYVYSLWLSNYTFPLAYVAGLIFSWPISCLSSLLDFLFLNPFGKTVAIVQPPDFQW